MDSLDRVASDGTPSPAEYTPARAPDLVALLALGATAAGADRVAARDKLRTAVRMLVDRLKAEGLPPERVLARVKTAVGADRRGSTGAATDASEALVADVVRWCIAAYYRVD